MKLQLDHGSGAYHIRSYRPGAIVVNDETLTRSSIIMPNELIRNWPPQSFEEVTLEHFEPIAALGPELVLFGTGARMRFAHRDWTAWLLEQGIGMESMDTAAACRSYSILMAEGRRVAAALLMIAP